MITKERLNKLPDWIKRSLFFMQKIKVPAKIVFILISLMATIWFLIRVIPKPTRATYPCMQVVAPIMSGFVIWILSLTGATLAFKKARFKLLEARYVAAIIFLVAGIISISVFSVNSVREASAASSEKLELWYQPNLPLGVARGIFPGRVAWGHNPTIASWDGKTGFWWDDQFNNQVGTDKLLSQTLFSLTNTKNEKMAWDAMFSSFNKTKKKSDKGYQTGQKVTIKVNLNNTYSHENNNEINANPQLILSLLKSLVNEAGVPQENITLTDPSRFMTNNVYEKCFAVFPKIHYVDHNGGDGREKAAFVDNAIPFSVDNGRVATGIAACIVEADYIINMALMKGHVGQGVTLCAKNYFGCTSIEADWRKNAHSTGFGQNREGLKTYTIFADYLGHKDLGEKTMLFLIDGIYGNKFVNQVPASRWALEPFNGSWPCSLFASQDGVAIDAVVLDFALAEWPDAPDMKYSDFSVNESALADNPPSGTVYDPERDGTRLTSLGVSEHWNNPTDKKYSRNLNTGKGIELIYKKIE